MARWQIVKTVFNSVPVVTARGLKKKEAKRRVKILNKIATSCTSYSAEKKKKLIISLMGEAPILKYPQTKLTTETWL